MGDKQRDRYNNESESIYGDSFKTTNRENRFGNDRVQQKSGYVPSGEKFIQRSSTNPTSLNIPKGKLMTRYQTYPPLDFKALPKIDPTIWFTGLSERISQINSVLDDLPVTVENLSKEQETYYKTIESEVCNMEKEIQKFPEVLEETETNLLNEEYEENKRSGIFGSLTNFLKSKGFFTKYEEQVPYDYENPANGNVFLFVASHGGYDVKDTFTGSSLTSLEYYKMACPIQKLIRLLYSPKGACSWSNSSNTIKNIKDLTGLLCHDSGKDIDIDALTTELNRISESNKLRPDVTQDSAAMYSLPNTLGEISICDNVDKSNMIITSSLNDIIIRKDYQLDLGVEFSDIADDSKIPPISNSRGIIFLCETSILLPINFVEENKDKIDSIHTNYLDGKYPYLNDNPSKVRTYTIGKLISQVGQHYIIKYDQNVELLSCPYFLLYIRWFYNGTRITPEFTYQYSVMDPSIEPALSLRPRIDKRRDLLRNMIFEFNTDVLYSYFQNAKILVNMDYSCSQISFEPRVETALLALRTQVFNKIMKPLYNTAHQGGNKQVRKQKILKIKSIQTKKKRKGIKRNTKHHKKSNYKSKNKCNYKNKGKKRNNQTKK